MVTMLQSSPFYRLTLDQLRSHAGLRVQENGPILVLLFPLTADEKQYNAEQTHMIPPTP